MKNGKTIELFDRFFAKYGVLQEQTPDVGSMQAASDMNAAPGIDPVASSVVPKEIDENEKYIIKILTNSFIFNPSIFNKEKQKYIFNKIESIERKVNVPVSTIINAVKQIIGLDKSLKVESKTVTLIQNYMTLIEQSPDATEKQPDAVEQDIKQKPDESATSENKLDLEEIFPLYKELLLQALKHVPTDEELMIIKPIVNEFGDVDPEKIVEAIQNILNQSLEDKEVEDDLSNV
jgi:hypothetical protein